METGCRARHRALLLAAALTAFPALADAGDEALSRQIAERVPALAERAQSACRAVVDPDRPAPVEIERAIHEAGDAVSRAVTSDATVSAAEPLLAELAMRVGDLDTVPSLTLHQLRNALAASGGDTARVIEGRAFVFALLQHIDRSGDGRTPATAWHPCLIGNEYAFVRQVLGAHGITEQTRVHEGERHYDRLTLAMADGSAREVYFDVTDLYRRNAEVLLR